MEDRNKIYKIHKKQNIELEETQQNNQSYKKNTTKYTRSIRKNKSKIGKMHEKIERQKPDKEESMISREMVEKRPCSNLQKWNQPELASSPERD